MCKYISRNMLCVIHNIQNIAKLIRISVFICTKCFGKFNFPLLFGNQTLTICPYLQFCKKPSKQYIYGEGKVKFNTIISYFVQQFQIINYQLYFSFLLTLYPMYPILLIHQRNNHKQISRYHHREVCQL